MSTKWIREAVETLLDHPNGEEAGRKALAELAAIDKNCRILDEHGVVHSMRFDESREDDELNDAADFLSAIGRMEEET